VPDHRDLVYRPRQTVPVPPDLDMRPE